MYDDIPSIEYDSDILIGGDCGIINDTQMIGLCVVAPPRSMQQQQQQQQQQQPTQTYNVDNLQKYIKLIQAYHCEKNGTNTFIDDSITTSLDEFDGKYISSRMDSDQEDPDVVELVSRHNTTIDRYNSEIDRQQNTINAAVDDITKLANSAIDTFIKSGAYKQAIDFISTSYQKLTNDPKTMAKVSEGMKKLLNTLFSNEKINNSILKNLKSSFKEYVDKQAESDPTVEMSLADHIKFITKSGNPLDGLKSFKSISDFKKADPKDVAAMFATAVGIYTKVAKAGATVVLTVAAPEFAPVLVPTFRTIMNIIGFIYPKVVKELGKYVIKFIQDILKLLSQLIGDFKSQSITIEDARKRIKASLLPSRKNKELVKQQNEMIEIKVKSKARDILLDSAVVGANILLPDQMSGDTSAKEDKEEEEEGNVRGTKLIETTVDGISMRNGSAITHTQTRLSEYDVDYRYLESSMSPQTLESLSFRQHIARCLLHRCLVYSMEYNLKNTHESKSLNDIQSLLLTLGDSVTPKIVNQFNKFSSTSSMSLIYGYYWNALDLETFTFTTNYEHTHEFASSLDILHREKESQLQRYNNIVSNIKSMKENKSTSIVDILTFTRECLYKDEGIHNDMDSVALIATILNQCIY